jgi:hypothetical protein
MEKAKSISREIHLWDPLSSLREIFNSAMHILDVKVRCIHFFPNTGFLEQYWLLENNELKGYGRKDLSPN